MKNFEFKATPAFPTGTWEYDGQSNVLPYQENGMTLQQYAAIKLKVPDSGEEWLDEMIRKSLRNDLVKQALCGFLSGSVMTPEGKSAKQWFNEIAQDLVGEDEKPIQT